MNDFEKYSLIIGAITAIFAIIFGAIQLRINARLKKLQDYVAISFLPSSPNGVPSLSIRNVGKVNVRIRQIQFADRSLNFEPPRLLAFGADSDYIFPIPTDIILAGPPEVNVNLYIQTEPERKKYLTHGAIAFDRVPIPVPAASNSASSQVSGQQVSVNLRAWTYTTRKFKWSI